MNPFLIFPEEVWEIILGHLKNSKDILAVVKAFPELQLVLTRNGYLWLFDQVLPELYPWLPQNEFFHCRQVCKRWSRVVDTFLEETTPDPQATGDLWLTPPGHRTYDDKQYWEGILLQGSNFLEKFMKDMEGISRMKNPFPGRHVNANVRRTRKDTHREFYRRFGSHIWFIQLGCNPSGQVPRRLRFWESLIGTLAQLPNLRRLELTEANNVLEVDGEDDPGSESDVSDEDWNADSDEEDSKLIEPLREFRSLPPLPHLTTLELIECHLPVPMAQMLIVKYSAQLERLLLQAKYWNREITSFPCLTQLCIWDVETKEMITGVLQRVEAPNLCSFQFGELDLGSSNVILSTVTDVFPWLGRFPQLERLHFYIPFHASESSDQPSEEEKFPLIKSLQIGDHRLRLNYNFLLRFPSLEELEIHQGRPRTEVLDCSKNSRVKIRESMKAGTMYKCNVWELLPKLQKLMVRSRSEGADKKEMKFRGNRRMYDYLRSRN